MLAIDDENNEIPVIFVVSEINFSLSFFPFCTFYKFFES
jgi:hypothetical protein